jgi:hypothetical protein
MPDVQMSIPEHLMLSRLAQSEQMREFFIEMWLQNPVMAKQAGMRVQEMLSPLGAVPPAPTFLGAEAAGLYFDV